MLKITKNLKLQDFSGLKVGYGNFRNLYEIENLQDFTQLLQEVNKEDLAKILTLGEGSNTVFIHKNENLDLIKINIQTIEPKENNILKVGAGVNWDLFVQKYIELGGVGMESLSAIPGTVGAAPVQNIGAYGKEISEFIHSIEVYDRQENNFKTLTKSNCKFKYRDSMFKHETNRYIILYVNFILIKSNKDEKVIIPEQKDIKNYLINKGNIEKASDLWENNNLNQNNSDLDSQNLTVNDIREAVVAVRKLKLPSPSVIPNCGSFFKNAILNQNELTKVKEKFPNIPVFPADGMRSGVEIDINTELVKIPVAYIIEKIGLKGIQKGNFGIHPEHALIVTGNGKGDIKEFIDFINFVKEKVYTESGITLEEEVNLI